MRVAPADAELASRQWLDILRLFADALRESSGTTLELDLSRIEWIGHLPLLALSLGAQSMAQAHFERRVAKMPSNTATRAFLERWDFYALLRRYGFEYDRRAEITYAESPSQTRVLSIHRITNADDARVLRDRLRRTDADLRKVLRASAYLNDRDVNGLADLVVYELCKNAAEHAGTRGDAFIFGRFSKAADRSRRISEVNAGPWETEILQSMSGKGLTELVLGDNGVGIVESLRSEAAERDKVTPEEILRWAFEPFSTRKHEVREHTRGLWAVKNKVRELRGLLYVRTGDGAGGGVSAWWDFLGDPSEDEPVIRRDDIPFHGAQFQILVPHRGPAESHSVIEWRKPRTAPSLQLEPHGFSIPSAPPPDERLGLREKIVTLSSRAVLFIDMSAMDDRWERRHVDAIGREIHEGLERHYGAIWLLNPSANVISGLQSSEWLRRLWERQAILVPIVTHTTAEAPPRVEYVVGDTAISSGGEGDTPHSRRVLLDIIGAALAGDDVGMHSLDDLDDDAQSWVTAALATNRALVVTHGRVSAALDVARLAAAVSELLLPDAITQLIDEKLALQELLANRAWYQLASRRFSRHYLGPNLFDKLPAPTTDALERVVERLIARTRAEYAISFATSAQQLLTRASRAGIRDRNLIPLQHYAEQESARQLATIPRGTRAVLLVSITGSGRTIDRIARVLRERDVHTTIICHIDTMTAADLAAMPLIRELHTAGLVQSIVKRPLETRETRPAADEPHAQYPIVVIDPVTLLPLAPVRALKERLRDGAFWKMVAESKALSTEPVTYKGIDYTTLLWARNLSRHPALYRNFILPDLKSCFTPAVLPDLICLPNDTFEAVQKQFKVKLQRDFPTSLVLEERELATDARARTGDFKGKYVVIFAIAASSGSGVARLLKHFETAQMIHLSIVINRIPEPVTAAFTRQSKVTLTTFKRIFSGSPELRTGSARSIAIRSLETYRPSCVSNRLLLFADERRHIHTEHIKTAQTPDELDGVAVPITPPEALELKPQATYDFTTPAAIEHLEKLVRTCTASDERWLYAILDEAASRAEAARRAIPTAGLSGDDQEGTRSILEDPPRLISGWRDQYVALIESLYRQAPADGDMTSRSVVLRALLLDRWEWHGDRDDRDAPQPTTFGNVLLEDTLRHTTPPALRAICIRTLSKLSRILLIDHLEAIINAARTHRETELTLALELSKILDDPLASSALQQRFETMIRKRITARPPAPDSELDVATDSIMADIGLEADASGAVDFIPWEHVRAILKDEPPDHDRTVRAVIRSMRRRSCFGADARFLYYREAEQDHFIYSDSFPRRKPTNTTPIPAANIQARELLKGGDSFFSPRIGLDKSSVVQEFRAQLRKHNSSSLEKWSVAVFEMRFRGMKGIFRVWQDATEYGEMKSDAVNEMQDAVRDAAKLLERSDSSLAATGMWQYQRTIESLQEHGGDTSMYDPLYVYTDRVRELLGGDIASMVVLETGGNYWRRRSLVGRPVSAAPLVFRKGDRSRLTTLAEVNRVPTRYTTRDAAAKAGFVEMPARWAQAWLALPLVHGDRCDAVVHVWHHTPGWFDAYDDDVLHTLASFGAGLAEVTQKYNEARAFHTRKFVRLRLDKIISRLVNLTLVADALAQDLAQANSGDSAVEMVADTLRSIQESVAEIPRLLEHDDATPVPTDIVPLVTEAVETARLKYGAEKFDLVQDSDIPQLDLDSMMLQRTLAELLKNATSHLAAGGKVLVRIRRAAVGITIEVENPGAGVHEDEKTRIFEVGTGLALAKATAERHGGRIEEVGEYGANALFRLTLPVGERRRAR